MKNFFKKTIPLGLLIAVVIGAFLLTGGYRSDRNSPKFLSSSVDPYKVKVGQIQTTRVSLESLRGIDKVFMKIPFEGGYDEVLLSLVEGDKNSGVWEGKWEAHNTLVKEYTTTITAADIAGHTNKSQISWWDDTETRWLSGWEQREKVVVRETSGSTLSNHKTEITVPYRNGMQADFDDIRFTSADGETVLNYYLAGKTDSVTSTFWVTIPSLYASADTRIYYYFGNQGASSLSNPAYAPDAGDALSWTETSTEDFGDGVLTDTRANGGNIILGDAIPSFVWKRKSDWDMSLDWEISGYSNASFADLDNDGDFDAVAAGDPEGYGGKPTAYKNIGTCNSPVWVIENSWTFVDVLTSPKLALGDLDNDGDFDLMVGDIGGLVRGYKNTGTVSSPVWTAQSSWNTPDLGTDAAPALADLDNDGDYDLLIGERSGLAYGYKNTGTVSSPVWTAQSSWNTPDVGSNAAPALADLDNDGDYDLLIGEGNSITYGYKNTGTTSAPVWTAQSIWNASGMKPSFVDIDGDGDKDLMQGVMWDVVGYEHTYTSGYATSGSYISSPLDTGSAAKLSSLSFAATVPANTSIKFQLASNDNNSTWNYVGPDGTGSTYFTFNVTSFPDIIQGKRFFRYKAYLDTTDSAVTPALDSITLSYIPYSVGWTETTTADFSDGALTDVVANGDKVELEIETNISWSNRSDWQMADKMNPSPVLGDLDGDGDKDLLLADGSGTVYGYRNTGSAGSTVWSGEPSWNFTIPYYQPYLALADLDNDGDLDLMIGEYNGVTLGYKNTGTVSNPAWTAQTSWNISDIGDNAAPALADLDNDGDLDLMIGEYNGVTYAYKNTGTVSNPVWTAQATWNTPNVGENASPALGDLDGDGDKDLLIGIWDGITYAYKNTGTTSAPAWTAQASWNVLDVGNCASPALGDLDGDGDLDLIIGENYGPTLAYKNTGTTSAPAWTSETGWRVANLGFVSPKLADLDNDGDFDLMDGVNGYRNIGNTSNPIWSFQSSWRAPTVSSYDASPALADLDNDGDFDLLMGEYNGLVTAYENTGSASSPVWTAKASWNAPDLGNYSSPAFADLDNDGDFDLLLGESVGIAYGYKNTGTASSPVWTAEASWNTPDVGIRAFPTLGDLDLDGDFDVMIGTYGGATHSYKNTGTASSPIWTAEVAWNPPSLSNPDYAASPVLADLDGNGKMDLLIGGYEVLSAYQNAQGLYSSSGNLVSSFFDVGTSFKPYSVFFNATLPATTSVKFQLAANNDNATWNYVGPDGTAGTYFDETSDVITSASLTGNRYIRYKAYLATGNSAVTPTLSDITINYAKIWRQTTTADFSGGTLTNVIAASDNLSLSGAISSDPVWTAQTGWNTPDIGTYAVPDLADLDNDGDLDMMVGDTGGRCLGYKNTGTSSSPVWAAETGWNSADIGNRGSCALADLDNDGDFDLMIGSQAGTIYGYKNTGTASAPTWTAQATWNAPDVGGYTNPALADLDGDGDFDLMIGSQAGTIYGYKNTGTASAPTWTAQATWNVADIGDAAAPTFADIDRDGDLDMMIGASNGITYAYKNTGTSSAPTWTAQASWNIPTIGTYSTPTLADLNNDTYVDILIGSNSGVNYAYRNVPNTVYSSSGNLVSSTFDGSQSISFGNIYYSKSLPANTTLRFQLSANNDNSTWSFTGPDNTGSTYYMTSSDSVSISSSLDGNRYIKYKAYLDTSNTAVTPVLNDIAISYIAASTGGGGGGPVPNITFSAQLEARPRPSGASGGFMGF